MKLVQFIKYLLIVDVISLTLDIAWTCISKYFLKKQLKDIVGWIDTGNNDLWMGPTLNFFKCFLYAPNFEMDILLSCLDDMGEFPNSNSSMTSACTLYIWSSPSFIWTLSGCHIACNSHHTPFASWSYSRYLYSSPLPFKTNMPHSN